MLGRCLHFDIAGFGDLHCVQRSLPQPGHWEKGRAWEADVYLTLLVYLNKGGRPNAPLAILESNRVAGDEVESYMVPQKPPGLSLCCLLVDPGATTEGPEVCLGY